MLSTPAITFREGLEAALITGIILAYIGYLGITLVTYLWPTRLEKGGELIANRKQYRHVQVNQSWYQIDTINGG
jgi:hypothetical protein